ncbi:hypothetical protein A4R43_36105 [Amycolatopsis albispora]|uniref:Uncharacterized protein n=1 Tax=Amycolatopsis albispora TaxID=1804986 RepID=A0A344LGN1_9PSEU|nr:hypothetical protein A4R43_36105 [Amycolatopsis albispora]
MTGYAESGLFGLLRDAAESGVLNPLLDSIPAQRATEPDAAPPRRRLLSCRSRLRRVLLLVGR